MLLKVQGEEKVELFPRQGVIISSLSLHLPLFVSSLPPCSEGQAQPSLNLLPKAGGMTLPPLERRQIRGGTPSV